MVLYCGFYGTSRGENSSQDALYTSAGGCFSKPGILTYRILKHQRKYNFSLAFSWERSIVNHAEEFVLTKQLQSRLKVNRHPNDNTATGEGHRHNTCTLVSRSHVQYCTCMISDKSSKDSEYRRVGIQIGKRDAVNCELEEVLGV